MAVIYSFGDSITYGAWGIKSSGWATLLRQHLDELQEKNPDYYALFYNLGIPGETTAGLVKRFENETRARVRETDKAVFIFAFGANDAAFLPLENKFRVSKEEFEKNLTSVLEKASQISEKIIIVNILPVVEALNSQPRNGKTRLNIYMQEYNGILESVAKKFNSSFIDVHSVFMKKGYETLLIPEDGLHPNDVGHEIMFDTIKPIVQKLLGWS